MAINSSPLFLLVVAMGFLLISSLVGAWVLRIAVQLHNRFAIDMRYQGIVDAPSPGKAFGMMLAINLILLFLSNVIQVLLIAAGIANQIGARVGAVACLVVLSLIVMTWILNHSLKAPWGRSMVISCIHSCITLVILLTIIGTFAFVAFYT